MTIFCDGYLMQILLVKFLVFYSRKILKCCTSMNKWSPNVLVVQTLILQWGHFGSSSGKFINIASFRLRKSFLNLSTQTPSDGRILVHEYLHRSLEHFWISVQAGVFFNAFDMTSETTMLKLFFWNNEHINVARNPLAFLRFSLNEENLKMTTDGIKLTKMEILFG